MYTEEDLMELGFRPRDAYHQGLLVHGEFAAWRSTTGWTWYRGQQEVLPPKTLDAVKKLIGCDANA